MSEPNAHSGQRILAAFGHAALWGSATAIVGSAHFAVAAWAMRAPTHVATDAPPPAILIELAPMIEAQAVDQTEISPDQVDRQASLAQREIEALQAEATEQVTSDAVPPEPEQEVTDKPAPDEILDDATVVLTSSLRPKLRPDSLAPQRPKPTPKPSKSKPAPQRANAGAQAAFRAQNEQAQLSTRNSAPTSARGQGRKISPAKWQSRLMAHLERRKPRSKGERGTAYVSFRIDSSGNVSGIRLARSSGAPKIDQAALALVRRASPVPAPPPGVPSQITVPIKFSRR